MTAYILEGLGGSYQGINQVKKPTNKSKGSKIFELRKPIKYVFEK
jgi:hypothetical protein